MRPLSLEEQEQAINDRVAIIKKEFEGGFKFLEKHPLSVTIFGSSHFKEGNPYYDHARVLGRKIVEDLGYAVLTGGGPGIMEAANRGAFEAKGISAGLTINLPAEQTTNKYLTSEFNFYYFFTRKVCLSFAAEAYIFYPGGFGTLDEFFEILTLVQTKKIIQVPVILAGKEYWQEFDSLIRNTLLEKFETIYKEEVNLYTITDDHNEIVDIIRKSPVREGLKCCGNEFMDDIK